MGAENLGKPSHEVCMANDFEKTLAGKIQENQLAAAQHLFNDCIGTRALGQLDGVKDNGMATYGVMQNIAQMYSQEIDKTKGSVWQELKDAKFPHPELAFKLDGVPEEK